MNLEPGPENPQRINLDASDIRVIKSGLSYLRGLAKEVGEESGWWDESKIIQKVDQVKTCDNLDENDQNEGGVVVEIDGIDDVNEEMVVLDAICCAVTRRDRHSSCDRLLLEETERLLSQVDSVVSYQV